MAKKGISRREFLKDSSILGAGVFLGAAGAKPAEAKEVNVDTSKIVNYNPKMGYRRLGKTNLMVSEISLGGHWRNRGGGRYWDRFANDECPPDVARNRTDIVSKCIECGINYLDITTRAECISYGIAVKGRREKMIVGADDHILGPRNPANRTVEKLVHDVEECLRAFKTDYFDIWRVQAQMNPPPKHGPGSGDHDRSLREGSQAGKGQMVRRVLPHALVASAHHSGISRDLDGPVPLHGAVEGH